MSRRIFRRCAIAIALASLAAPAAATTFYVGGFGAADGNPGHAGAPFATIQRCADTAQPGDVCRVRAGIYRESVRPPRSGDAGAPIVFEADDGATVTIDGTDLVSGWTPVAGGPIHVARVPRPVDAMAPQVFVRDEMMSEARWPNAGPELHNPTWARMGAGTTYTHIVEDPNWQQPRVNLDGAIVHIWSGPNPFAHQTARVTSSRPGSFDTTTIIANGTCPDLCATQGGFYFVVGKLELLDAPREWHYDANAERLYFRAPGDVDPASLEVRFKSRESAFDLSGRSNIVVRGFRLFANTVITDDATSGVVLERLHARYVSHFEEHVWHVPTGPAVVEGDYSSVLPARALTTGIRLNGRGNTLRDSAILTSAGNGILVRGEGHLVENNYVRDTGYMGSYASGINLGGRNQRILRNTIRRTGREGITVDWHVNGTSFPDNEIAFNDIGSTHLLTADGGGIYICCTTDASGTVIHHNVFHDQGVVTRPGGYGFVGIYIDNSTNYTLVHHNLVWNYDRGIHMNGHPSQPWSRGNRVYNNTFDTQIGMGTNFAESGLSIGTVFSNNIFRGPTEGARLPGSVFENNLTADVNPQFRRVIGADRDYRLSNGSPAIDTGLSIAGITDDAIGRPDMGAFEAGGAMWSAGCTHAACPPTAASRVLGERPLRRASDRIEAESYDAQSGILVENDINVGYFEPGDWLRYRIDFGAGANTFTARIACRAEYANQQLDIRLGSPDGPTIGTLTIPATGDWQVYTERTVSIQPVSGVQDVYLVGRGDRSIGNLDWFTFGPALPAELRVPPRPSMPGRGGMPTRG